MVKILVPDLCNKFAGTTKYTNYLHLVYTFAVGGLLVLSSYYRLGIINTYLGDHFGILLKQRVTGFPFNYFNHPMYEGSTLIFLGYALL